MSIIADLVYTWTSNDYDVTANSMMKYSPPDELEFNRRFRSNDEIYVSIKSALTYAPWLRFIWVVIDDIQLHLFDMSRLPSTDKVKVIPHSSIFSNKENLPTFNSQAIECHLANIPGLAELFLYANDDTFFGSSVSWSLFYSPNKKPLIQEDLSEMPMSVAPEDPLYLHARANNMRILMLLNGKREVRKRIIHQIKPLTKRLYRLASENKLISEVMEQTSKSRFRSDMDVEPTGLLLHWALDNKEAYYTNNLKCYYKGIYDTTNLDLVEKRIAEKGYHLFCLNDMMATDVGHHRYRFFISERLSKLITKRVVVATHKVVKQRPKGSGKTRNKSRNKTKDKKLPSKTRGSLTKVYKYIYSLFRK